MSRFDSGWYKIHRKMMNPDKQSNDFYGDCVLQALWNALIAWANIKDAKTRTGRDQVLVLRGQLVTSHQELALFLGASRHSVRSRMDYLEQTGRIKFESKRRVGTVVTIINFGQYQFKEEPKEEPKKQSPKKSKYTFSAADAELAARWVSYSIEHSPGRKEKPSVEKFADDIRKLRKRYDKMDQPGALEAVFDWSAADEFWKDYIPSPNAMNTKSKSDPDVTRMIQILRKWKAQSDKTNGPMRAAELIDSGKYAHPY